MYDFRVGRNFRVGLVRIILPEKKSQKKRKEAEGMTLTRDFLLDMK